MRTRRKRLLSGIMNSNFTHKFISENCNLLVFLNESNQYDLSVDGVKFSSLYSGQTGQTAPVQTSGCQPTGGVMNLSKIANTQGQAFGGQGNFSAGQGQGFGHAQDPYAQSVSYENPDRIFNSGGGVGQFKFDGFGKDAWGIYSSGLDSQQDQTKVDPWVNPFDKSAKTFDAFSQPASLGVSNEDTKGSIWHKDMPAEPTVIEDKSKGKKGFL